MADTVTIEINGGPSITNIPWFEGMNCQAALEGAYNLQTNSSFTYAIQFYGSNFGYLVCMINETYDTYVSISAPFFYWELLVNGKPSSAGIDSTVLNPGDVVGFAFEMYVPEKHAGTPLEAKHQARAH